MHILALCIIIVNEFPLLHDTNTKGVWNEYTIINMKTSRRFFVTIVLASVEKKFN